MAARKATKTEAKTTETAERKGAEPGAEEIKAEQKGTETKAASAKKTTTAASKKSGTAKGGSKKTELKQKLYLQYGGKSYAQEDLLKIAKDVWKYDLKKKAGELASVELYVKPEENKVYYVMNGEFTGSFDI